MDTILAFAAIEEGGKGVNRYCIAAYVCYPDEESEARWDAALTQGCSNNEEKTMEREATKDEEV